MLGSFQSWSPIEKEKDGSGWLSILRMFGPEPIASDCIFTTFRESLFACSQSCSFKRSKFRSFCRSSILFEEREMAVSSAYVLTNARKKANHWCKSGTRVDQDKSLGELHNLFASHQRRCHPPWRIVYWFSKYDVNQSCSRPVTPHSLFRLLHAVGFYDQPQNRFKPSSSQ